MTTEAKGSASPWFITFPLKSIWEKQSIGNKAKKASHFFITNRMFLQI
jgi:hypothetical protein